MAGFEFGKNYRLLSANDFNYLKKNSDLISDPCLRLYFKPTQKGGPISRIGFSISTKVGNAVLRNRTRRILREIFRLKGDKSLGLDILVVVNPFLYKKAKAQEEAEKSLKKSFLLALSKLPKKL
ncbi:MAG: ribonuclease P protein component [Bacteriovoracales bacterium]